MYVVEDICISRFHVSTGFYCCSR